MSHFSSDTEGQDTRAAGDGDHVGAWAAAAVLLIAVMLASGAVG